MPRVVSRVLKPFHSESWNQRYTAQSFKQREDVLENAEEFWNYG